MAQICIGPVCIPYEALLPFLYLLLRYAINWFNVNILGHQPPKEKDDPPPNRPPPGPRTWIKSEIIHLEDQDHLDRFKSEAAKAGVPIVLDFTATWCGPCKAIAPKFEELSKIYNGAFAKVDVDDADDVAAFFGVRSMPTFIVLDKEGKEVVRFAGANALRLEKAVSNWCNLVI